MCGQRWYCRACYAPLRRGVSMCDDCRAITLDEPHLSCAVRAQPLRIRAARMERVRGHAADVAAELARRGGKW